MRRGLAMVVALLAVTALAAPASAEGNGAVQLSGLGAPAGEGDCTALAADFKIVLEGDLVGCVYQYFEEGEFRPSGTYIERGYEIFDVCLSDGETCGTFETTYVFTAKYADTDFSGQEWGRCQHPIVAGTGTGDFTGVTGRLDFKDDVAAGNFAMRGHISLP